MPGLKALVGNPKKSTSQIIVMLDLSSQYNYVTQAFVNEHSAKDIKQLNREAPDLARGKGKGIVIK